MRRRPDGVWICQACGETLRRRRPLRSLPLVGGAMLVALGFGLAGAQLPVLEDLALLLDPPAPLLASLLPHPGPGGLEGLDTATLMDRLAQADADWIPRAELLPDGRTRYHYRRRSGDPQLSLPEIRALMLNPPTFALERRAILELLDTLSQAGVRIQLSQPRKPGAAGEWDPREHSLRIKPEVVASGSVEFLHVLNHEAIHVAQSCSNGHLRATPRPLGISERVPPDLEPVLDDPLYRQVSPLERRLEREAYANQHQPGHGADQVRRHCRPATAPLGPSRAGAG
jgi:hypothetical protein